MDQEIIGKIVDCTKKYSEVQLFIVFGSRARDEAKKDSDWDFGYIAAPNFDNSLLYTDLTLLLQTDKIDLANLSKVTGLLRFRVAQDGKLLYEKSAGEYHKFWLQAVHFWCDAGPIIRAEYEARLRRIV